jgi:hypothetical protein
MSIDRPEANPESLIYRDEATPLIQLGQTSRAGLRDFLIEASAKASKRRSGSESGTRELDTTPNYGRNFENYARNFENYARNFENYARNFENYGRSASESHNFKSAMSSNGSLPNGDAAPKDIAELRSRMKK